MDADNTSADLTFRRNSPKSLSSLELVGLLVIVIFVIFPGADWPILCRDPIAVNFLSQGWNDQTCLWKTFARHFPVPGAVTSTRFASERLARQLMSGATLLPDTITTHLRRIAQAK
jgi:hypothetical protein